MLKTSLTTAVRRHFSSAVPGAARAVLQPQELLATTLPTAVDPTSAEFIERASAMRVLEDELRTNLHAVYQGGGAKARAKVRQAGNGKLLVRERYIQLYHLR